MKSQIKTIIPYRIKQARLTRGLSLQELAERIGVTRQAVSQYELGKTEPSKGILNSLSSTLKYPASFFYKPMPPENFASSCIFFRSGRTAQKKSYNLAKEKLKIFGEINAYLKQFVCFPDVNLPKFEQITEPMSNEEIERYATELRLFWGLGDKPINNLLGTVEKNGIVISCVNLGFSKIEALSVWHNKIPFIFLCTNKDSCVRVRFSVAHELAHILLHSETITDESLKNRDLHKRLEDEANIFAGALLLPEKTFSKDIYSSSIDHFIQLKSKWKTSISAMINRCETLNLLSESQIKYLQAQMTKRRYWRNEPLDDVLKIEKPVAQRQAVELLLDKNIITAYDFGHDTGIALNELEEYCALQNGVLTDENKNNTVYLRLF